MTRALNRGRSALALVLLIVGTLVPGEALCLDALCAGAHLQHSHACCRHTSRTPTVKACCAPQPAQQSAIPQANSLPSVAAHLHDCAPVAVVAHLSQPAHAHAIVFPPDAAPAPPLVLRT